jgi:pimeloyl-ACP methyl ester carboxylesterase
MVAGSVLADPAPQRSTEEVQMQYLDIPESSATSTLILVHGSWHTGSCWVAVQEQLAEAGIRSVAPTLPGHGIGAGGRDVRHADYVSAVITALDPMGERAVLVGHSFGGSVISRVAELRPDSCRGLVYYSAFVPRDGERVADSLPPEFIEFLDAAAAASPERTIALPDELVREAFANTADKRTLARIETLLVAEPHGPIFEPLSLPTFPTLDIPVAYITCRDDRALPPGLLHPGQSSRLRDPEVIEIEGDHECLLTAPERLADALIEAVDRLQGTMLLQAGGREAVRHSGRQPTPTRGPQMSPGLLRALTHATDQRRERAIARYGRKQHRAAGAAVVPARHVHARRKVAAFSQPKAGRASDRPEV